MLACICKDQPLQAIDLTLSTTKFSEMTACLPAFLAIDHKDKQKSYPYIVFVWRFFSLKSIS